MYPVVQTVVEGFAFVMDTKAAAEVKNSIVIIQGQGFQEGFQFSKACPDFRRVGLVGLGIGLVQLIQYGFAIGVIGIEGMGIYVVFQPLYDIIHVGTSWLSVV